MIVHLAKGASRVVGSYRAARAAVLLHWDGEGSAAFYRDRVAGIIEDCGEAIAHVSYNGRVWQGAKRFASNGTEIALEPIDGCVS